MVKLMLLFREFNRWMVCIYLLLIQTGFVQIQK